MPYKEGRGNTTVGVESLKSCGQVKEDLKRLIELKIYARNKNIFGKPT